MDRTALIDGPYRYTLTRQWNAGLPLMAWIMLNPSTADADRDDPSIRRCVSFAGREGYGGIYVANLFAWRATDPDDLPDSKVAVGPDNGIWLRAAVSHDLCIAAWGSNRHAIRGVEYNLLYLHGASLSCLGLTRMGQPRHPLYLPANAPLRGFAI